MIEYVKLCPITILEKKDLEKRQYNFKKDKY